MEELKNTRQSSNESIMDFYNRIDHLQTRLLKSITAPSEIERTGATYIIKQFALQRFIYHSNSSISMCLRTKRPLTLSEVL